MLAVAVCLGLTFAGCNEDDNNGANTINLRQWRDINNQWLAEMQSRKGDDGQPYYKTIIPRWDAGSFVLVHYFNERSNNPDLLKPLYTSTIDVRYRLELYNGTPVDSSTNVTTWGPGIYRAQLSSLIPGWAAAVCDMNVGDTAEVIVPYQMGYGTSSTGSIPGYSNLKLGIRLVDIAAYELPSEQ